MIFIMKINHNIRGRLDVLVSLDALLETRSVTAAAKRIGVTQPAMSRALERLRENFDDPLLVRAGSGMQRTPRGESLREPLREILAAAADLYAPVEFDPARAERTFRVVIPDVVAAPLLPGLLERFSREAPGCRLHLVPWPDNLGAVGDIDFMISSELSPFPTFRKQPLFRDHDVLAFRGSAPPKSDPLDLDHVAVIAAGLVEDPVDVWLRECGRTRRIATVVPHYLLALHLVSRTGLYAILPSRTVSILGPSLGVSAAELRIDQEQDQQWLLYPPRLEADPGSLWLRGLVADVCGRSGAESR